MVFLTPAFLLCYTASDKSGGLGLRFPLSALRPSPFFTALTLTHSHHNIYIFCHTASDVKWVGPGDEVCHYYVISMLFVEW